MAAVRRGAWVAGLWLAVAPAVVAAVPAWGQPYQVLHSLVGKGDGRRPNAGLAIDAAGDLFGTTATGGRYGYGTVFELVAGNGAFLTLYDFRGQPDGNLPDSAPVIDSAGNLYGTTAYGGSQGASPGLGTVWKLAPPARPGGRWTGSVVHSFAGQPADGATPQAQLLLGAGGVLFGTTVLGGTAGFGTAFSLAPPQGGGAWALSVLHDFAGGPADGGYPVAGLLPTPSGQLVGTTAAGGLGSGGGLGTVFRLDPPKHGGGWPETTLLHLFTGAPADGAVPFGKLVEDASGVFYGTSSAGGLHGEGTVWTLGPDGTFALIDSFAGKRGKQCFAGLLADASGRLFGTTYLGGAAGRGTVFALTKAPGGTRWAETVLWSFQGRPDGEHPYAALVQDAAGTLFGTTFLGGTAGHGTIFAATPPPQ